LLLQMYSNEQVFISHAGPQKHFALHLRTQLRHAGISTFVDARDLQPGQQNPAGDIMKTACQQAEAAIFVITRDFLRRPATIQELRWVLAQHEPPQQGLAATIKPPQLVTVLYPTSVLRSSRNGAELQHDLQQVLGSGTEAALQLPGYAVQLVDKALNDAAVDVDDLLHGSLADLLHMYHSEGTAGQAVKDLKSLARLSVFRQDSVARYGEVLPSSWQLSFGRCPDCGLAC
jgi:TIR domain